MDSIFKFMSTKTVLQRIFEIQAKFKHNYEAETKKEFERKSVIADWGNKRTYIVERVIFNSNPQI